MIPLITLLARFIREPGAASAGRFPCHVSGDARALFPKTAAFCLRSPGRHGTAPPMIFIVASGANSVNGKIGFELFGRRRDEEGVRDAA